MLHTDHDLIESQETILIRAAMLDLINGREDAASLKIRAALQLMLQQLAAIERQRAKRAE